MKNQPKDVWNMNSEDSRYKRRWLVVVVLTAVTEIVGTLTIGAAILFSL